MHGADDLAGAIFEIAQHGLQLLFHLRNLDALLAHTLRLQPIPLARDFLLALHQFGALLLKLAQLGVQAVEEAGDVLGLGAEASASLGDDALIQAQALGDVDAGGGPGNAGAQLVSGLQGALIEADGGIEHAGGVGRIDLE